MPNRIIKESICTSPNIESLSYQAETLFYRIIVNCDDYGRMEYEPVLLRSKCYPKRIDRITNAEIEGWVGELGSAGLIIPYSVDGRFYIQVTKWETHQQIRAKRSKYPAPDSTDYHLIADDSKCPRNPIQSESNPNPIYKAWNDCGIIVHQNFTSAMANAIEMARKDYSEEDIIKAIRNYSVILKNDEYYWSHKWTLVEFLSRHGGDNIERFIDLEVAKENFADRNNGSGTHRADNQSTGNAGGNRRQDQKRDYTGGKYGKAVRRR